MKKQYTPLMIMPLGWVAGGILLQVTGGQVSEGWGIATVVLLLAVAVLWVSIHARRVK